MNGHNFVLLPEFLMPDELASLREYTFAREADFEASYVVAPGSNRSTVDPSHRRSRVLFDIGRVGALLVERLRFYLDRVVRELNCEPFPVSEVEAQITASNDGDFFHVHADNHEAPLRSRELTFVYFFHGEPRRFRGGELRIYGPAETGTFETIVPEQNQLVVFRSRLLHEVRPVRCPSRHFADSRFTLNGWFRR